jgi:hypothetical protein
LHSFPLKVPNVVLAFGHTLFEEPAPSITGICSSFYSNSPGFANYRLAKFKLSVICL